jgi:ABC-type sugar transport system permease subunit
VRRFLKPEALTGYVLILPAVVLMLVLLAYPFILAAYSSMISRVPGEPGKSISFRNFLKLLQGSLFRQTVWKPFGKGTLLRYFHTRSLRVKIN